MVQTLGEGEGGRQRMIMIDIPQVAYKTMCIEYRIYDNDGNRCRMEELEAEERLEHSLRDYRYSTEHDHVY